MSRTATTEQSHDVLTRRDAIRLVRADVLAWSKEVIASENREKPFVAHLIDTQIMTIRSSYGSHV